MNRLVATLVGLALASCSLSESFAETKSDSSPGDVSPVSYYKSVRPLLQTHCQGCHQPAKAGGSFVMTSVNAMQRSGDSESVGIVAGKSEASFLIEQITPTDGVSAMPQESDPLSEEQIALISRWIDEGAIDDTPENARRHYDSEHPPQYTRPPVITSVDISPDGSLIAVAGFHEIVLHLTNEETGAQPLARLIGMSERIASVKFSPDGKKLAATGGSPARLGEVQIWDVASRQLECSIPVTYDTVYGASWSPDGKLLAFGCSDNSVRAIDVSTGEQVLFQSAHSDWVLGTVFSADGSHLASVGRDATAKLTEVATQRFVDNITSITPGALRGGINAVARQPQRDEILFGGADGVPKIYRMHRTTKRVIGDDANLIWQLPPLPGRIFSVDYSEDGQRIVAGSSLDGKGAVHLYGIAAAPEIPDEIKAILVKPTHQRKPEEIKQLDKHFAEGIRVIAQIPFDDGGIYAVATSSDGSRVVAAGSAGKVRVFDGITGEMVREFVPVELTERQPSVSVESTKGLTESVTDQAPLSDQSPQPRASSEPTESLTNGAEVLSLTVHPESIQLQSSPEYVQLLVSAKLASGYVVDVTRQCKLQLAQPVVSISPSGLVEPKADGPSTLIATFGGKTASIPVDVTGTNSPLHPDYVSDIAPILARAGCNAGTCHGAQDGKNGFKLSLRGYDPLFDVRALTDDLASRRTDLAATTQSLMLLKATASVPHQGGQVIEPGSNNYRQLLAWIEDGAVLEKDSPRVTHIEVAPINPIVQTLGSRQQMRVVAFFSDGQQRDVTREAFVESADSEVAKLVSGSPGQFEVLRRGEAPLLFRYEGLYTATTITVMGDRQGFVWQETPTNNPIDKLVHAKLQRTKTSPAPLCDDYTFLRRLTLDLTGLPPTIEQIEAFQNDARDSRWKRNNLIDQLIGSPDYVEHWSNKWADLLQVNSKFLGREGAEAFRNWIHDEIAANRPYDQFALSVLTASGSTKENPAASYYKILRDPEVTMENTTHLFLATRFNCNKCHDHPFERWTQDQYYQMTAFFARVGLKKDPASNERKVGGTSVRPATPLYEVVFTKPEGEVKHLRTGKEVAPKFPFACDYECEDAATRREQLAAWITSPNNPYFAKSYVNRIWAYLTGRGFIEPIDDIRAGNPPTNPELLDWLTKRFVASGFDVQQLIRTICQSRTYQLGLSTDEFNEDDQLNYSHARTRRLPAEVLYDAIYRTTGAQSTFPGVPKGTRAAALPDIGIQLPDGFLNNLGRPPRESSCECERSNELQLGPIMALINGATVGEAVNDPQGVVAKLAASELNDQQLLEKLFLQILGRPAQSEELIEATKIIGGIQKQHEKLLAQLKQYSSDLEPITEKRKQKWSAALKAAQQKLTTHEQKIAPGRERLRKEREQLIAAMQAEKATIHQSLLKTLPAWEVARSSDSTWESLNPIELKTVRRNDLRVLADRSILAQGRNGYEGSHEIVAPADLTGVTGVKIEALADKRLPRQGPGRADDGNFVLSELKLSTLPDTPSPVSLVQIWDFSTDTEGWQTSNGTTLTPSDGRLVIEHKDKTQWLSRQIAAQAVPLALEITAKLPQETNVRIVWQTEKNLHYSAERSSSRKFSPGNSTWRTYRLGFHPKSPLKQLKLEFSGGGTAIPIDAIRLVQADAVEFSPVKLQNAQADFSQADFSVEEAIDGKIDKTGNGWAVAPQLGSDHRAIFETTEDYSATGLGFFRTELVHKFAGGKHNLGRFRISITRSPQPINFGLPAEIAELLAIPTNDRSVEQQDRLVAYFLKQDKHYTQQLEKIVAAEKPVPPDAETEQLKQLVAKRSKPLPMDPKLAQLQRAVKLSKQQLAQNRLTIAQDVAWALINSPEFLYNH